MLSLIYESDVAVYYEHNEPSTTTKTSDINERDLDTQCILTRQTHKPT